MSLSSNTKASRAANIGELESLLASNRNLQNRLQRELWIETAMLRKHSGDTATALRLYQRAMKFGLGRRSVRDYLQLAEAVEGADGRKERMLALWRMYPRHPILAELGDEKQSK
ncbi:MAG: hypothetical protein GY811_07005 [Myxococcales bacterium]|nr:hypothetical protein [Myxococcales bacterium]